MTPVEDIRGRGPRIQSAGQRPGGSGAKLRGVVAGDDVSQVCDVARVCGPDTVGSSQGEGVVEIVLWAQATSNGGGFLKPELELGASIGNEGEGTVKVMADMGGMDGWMAMCDVF